MKKSELEKYRTALNAKLAELGPPLRDRESIVIEKAPDELDQVKLAEDREIAIRNLDRQSNLLRAIRAALARIEDGTYGICLRCDQPIKPQRLAVLPWAAYCVPCQEIIDRQQVPGEGLDEQSLNNAAA